MDSRAGPARLSEQASRLARRRVWRDGEPEEESVPQVLSYCRRSRGRFETGLEIVHRLGLGAGPPVLELGCEPWLFTQLLLERGIEVVGAAVRPGETARSAEVRIEWDERRAVLEQRLFDAERDRWPWPDGSFETVLCMEVLEHLTFSPAHLLHEANRVLAPGGILVLTTPNALAATKWATVVRGGTVQRPYSGYGTPGRHNREYTPEELRRILAAANFEPTVATRNVAGYESPDRAGRVLQRLASLRGARPARRRDHLFAVARKDGPPRLAFLPGLYEAFDRDRMRRQGIMLADEA